MQNKQVSEEFLSLIHKPENFRAGNIANYFENWKSLTSDRFILNIVRYGYQIEFITEPCEECNRLPINFNSKEQEIISNLLSKFENKGIIVETEHEAGEIVSHIFIRPKPDGTYRLILNLSRLNEHVDKITFKMETLRTALQLIRRNCFFGKMDLKDAFFSVSIHRKFRKYLKFIWQGKLYAFTCLPNGLSTASRIFTKVLKPMFSTLRKLGHTNVAYIDDSLLQSDTFEGCKLNIRNTLDLADSLGLTVHPEKSIIIPTQCIEFVGFMLDSRDMTIRLATRKILDIKKRAGEMLKETVISIRDFAKLIGKMIAAEPGVKYAPLYYKSMEIERDMALKMQSGNFDAKMNISNQIKEDLKWWIANIDKTFRPISLGPPNRRIESDSSMTGYGGHDVTFDKEFSGCWTAKDKEFHINYLELKAAFLCLKYFCHNVTKEHIHLYLDNTVAIKYISKMGGRKAQLNNLAKEIWRWCEKRNIWLSVFHIPGKLNIRADELSRLGKKLNDDMEWALQQEAYNDITTKMGICDIDLFASKRNKKLETYVSYIPDDKAVAVNAFSISWENYNCYAFPPFSVIGRVVQKLCEDQGEMILVAPIFPSQPWFPQMLRQLCGQSYVLPKTDQILYLPGKGSKHRLTTMRLGAFRLSGKPSSVLAYQKKLQTSSCAHGDLLHKSNMGRISKNGCFFVIANKLIQLTHL